MSRPKRNDVIKNNYIVVGIGKPIPGYCPFTPAWIPLLFPPNIFAIWPQKEVCFTIQSKHSWFLEPWLSALFFNNFVSPLAAFFLHIKGKVPIWFTIKKICINTFFVFIVLTVLTVLVSLLIDPPPWKSDNLQYIPIVFFTVVFFPPLLTPMFALIAIWRSISQKIRKFDEKEQHIHSVPDN